MCTQRVDPPVDGVGDVDGRGWVAPSWRSRCAAPSTVSTCPSPDRETPNGCRHPARHSTPARPTAGGGGIAVVVGPPPDLARTADDCEHNYQGRNTSSSDCVTIVALLRIGSLRGAADATIESGGAAASASGFTRSTAVLAEARYTTTCQPARRSVRSGYLISGEASCRFDAGRPHWRPSPLRFSPFRWFRRRRRRRRSNQSSRRNRWRPGTGERWRRSTPTPPEWVSRSCAMAATPLTPPSPPQRHWA